MDPRLATRRLSITVAALLIVAISTIPLSSRQGPHAQKSERHRQTCRESECWARFGKHYNPKHKSAFLIVPRRRRIRQQPLKVAAACPAPCIPVAAGSSFMRAVWILPDEQIWSFLLQAIYTPGSYHGSPARKTAGAARVPREREMERERETERDRERARESPMRWRRRERERERERGWGRQSGVPQRPAQGCFLYSRAHSVKMTGWGCSSERGVGTACPSCPRAKQRWG